MLHSLALAGRLAIRKSVWTGLCLTACLFFATATSYAQGSYTSANNNTGNWESASIWTKEFNWMSEPSVMTDVGGSYMFNIYGYVTRNGNLTVSGGGGLVINDTLVITGNLSMTTSTGITVGTNGLLIVLGDFYSTGGGNKINVQGNGRVAIVGNYQQAQGSVTTGNAFYIYDDTPEFTSGGCNGGASVDGLSYACPPPNTAALTNLLDDEQDLSNNDPPLEEFLGNLGVTCGFANLNLNAGQSICSGSTPTQLTAATIASGTYRWEWSTTSATTGFSTAGGTSNAQNYTPPALTQTTWIRRKVTRSGCTNTSAVTVITVEAGGTWRGTSNNNWGTAGNWCGGVPTTTTDVVIKPSTTGNYPAVNVTANARNITITSGTSITLTSNNTLNIYGSVINSGTWTTTGGTVAFVGNAAQSVSGGSHTFNNLTINNTSGTQVTFNSNVTVTGTLTLTAGKVNMSGNTLTMGINGNTRGTLASTVGPTSWIYNGTLSRWMQAATGLADGNYAGFFPVGSATDFRPFWVAIPTPPNTNRINTAGTIRVSHAASTTVATNLSITDGVFTIASRQNSSWTVTTGDGIVGGVFDIKMGGTNYVGINNPTHLRVMRATTTAGGSHGGVSGTAANFLAARTSVPLAGLAAVYYIGTVDPGNSPLPVKLISFTAAPTNKGITIDWKSVSEENFDYYELQRAGEDLVFAPLARIENKGGHNLTTTYQYLDTRPFSGKHYYRLKSVDVDGSFEYSDLAWATLEFSEVNAYPNPVVGKKFVLELQDLANSPVAVIMNSRGNEVVRLAVSSGRQEISLPAQLDPGIYYLRIPGVNKVIKLSVL